MKESRSFRKLQRRNVTKRKPMVKPFLYIGVCTILHFTLPSMITTSWGHEGQEVIQIDVTEKEVNIALENEEIFNQNEKSDENYDCSETGFTTARLNVRSEADENSYIMGTLPFNDKIEYSECEETDEWYVIEYNDEYAYVNKNYVSNEPVNFMVKAAYNDKRKSYMSYKAITNKRSNQYKLQKMAYTDNHGLRKVEDRYCIALGSYYTTNIGQCVDLVLANGEIIPAIVSDCKADIHTNAINMNGLDGGIAEFVVETRGLPKMTKKSGDISYLKEEWKSPVVEIRVYDRIISVENKFV